MTDKTFFKQTIKSVPIENKTVLLRADYNVPLKEDGQIADDFRVRSSLPTIQYLLDRGCKVVIISHLGRPDGKPDPKASLRVVGSRLSELLGQKVTFVDDCIGDNVSMTVKKANSGSVILLENLRFYPEEEEDDSEFARKLATSSKAQYFVQDGFGVVHRAHASTDAITQYVPSVAGLLLEKEYVTITEAMAHPKKPLVAILGGAKVSDKLPLIKAIIPIAEQILIGGAMANTFLAAKGVALGKSKYEADKLSEIEAIYKEAAEKVGQDHVDDFLALPKDLAVGASLDNTAKRKNVTLGDVADDEYALDIGDETIEDFVSKLHPAKTVIWNGTLGYAELPEFAHGSARVALELATNTEVTSIIGGGDTADFALHWDSKSGGSFTHVSTGGGASLELMSGEKLPGVESLLDASSQS
ncbi:MAG TPA: phosphoglycerate kinase [Candidatus Saccharimonadales bacterium]